MSYNGTSNIAVAYLKDTGKELVHYDGDCDKLASDIIDWAVDEFVEIMYMEPAAWGCVLPCGNLADWEWHMVAVIDGIVHDAWFPDLILPPDEYIDEAFPGVEVTFNIQSHTIRPKCVPAVKIKTSL